VPELKSALQLDETEFFQRFGFKKPVETDDNVPIVVSCLRGGRAAMANSAFQGMGYNNIKVYSGSFLDWVANGGPVEKN
jgi:rhodanese-related sulfurtransferase